MNYLAVNDSTRLRITKKFVFREEDDGALLFNPDTGNVQILNASAAQIFRLLETPTSIEKLMTKLKLIFDDMNENSRDQVFRLVRELVALEALQVIE